MNTDFCQKTLEFLKIKNVKTAAFIVDNMGFSTLYKELEPLNKDIEITPYFYSSETRDFRNILAKIAATKPDIIVVWGTDPSRTLIIEQAKQTIPKLPITGIFDAIPNPRLVEGIPFVSELPLTTSFNEKFQKRFYMQPKMYSPFAYDTVQLLVTVFEKNSKKRLKGKELKDAILRETSFVGACGKVTMTPTGLIKLEPNIQVFKNGRPVAAQYMNNLFLD
jgi:ABC-type branched-subunit amino acid transport system substrate-binding protein